MFFGEGAQTCTQIRNAVKYFGNGSGTCQSYLIEVKSDYLFGFLTFLMLSLWLIPLNFSHTFNNIEYDTRHQLIQSSLLLQMLNNLVKMISMVLQGHTHYMDFFFFIDNWVFSSTTIWKHQSFSARPSLWSSSHICMWLLEKTIVHLTTWTFVGKVISLLLNMLSRFVIAFLPKSKRLLISWLQSPSTVIWEGAQENKICHCFYFFPFYLPWSDGTRCHGLVFFYVEF